eukprot:2633531-Amphidinium_carterae.3
MARTSQHNSTTTWFHKAQKRRVCLCQHCKQSSIYLMAYVDDLQQCWSWETMWQHNSPTIIPTTFRVEAHDTVDKDDFAGIPWEDN